MRPRAVFVFAHVLQWLMIVGQIAICAELILRGIGGLLSVHNGQMYRCVVGLCVRDTPHVTLKPPMFTVL